MISGCLASRAVIAAAIMLGLGQIANADLFVLGSTYTINGTDPSTGASFNSSVLLTSGSNQLVDLGAINLNLSIVPTSGQGEWLVFTYTTVSGQPISQPNLNWNMDETGLDAAVPVNFDAAFVGFSLSGVNQTPTANIFPGYSIEPNPVPGLSGTVLGANNFNADIAAGPLPELGTFIQPFSFLQNTGITDTVNGYTEGLLFYPQTTPVPEPSSAIFLLTLFAGAFVVRRRMIP